MSACLWKGWKDAKVKLHSFYEWIDNFSLSALMLKFALLWFIHVGYITCAKEIKWSSPAYVTIFHGKLEVVCCTIRPIKSRINNKTGLQNRRLPCPSAQHRKET